MTRTPGARDARPQPGPDEENTPFHDDPDGVRVATGGDSPGTLDFDPMHGDPEGSNDVRNARFSMFEHPRHASPLHKRLVVGEHGRKVRIHDISMEATRERPSVGGAAGSKNALRLSDVPREPRATFNGRLDVVTCWPHVRA